LPHLIRGNERFGRRLLQQVHFSAPDRNVVLSPISLSIIFTALQVNSTQPELGQEITSVFGWPEYRGMNVSARMLLAAFKEPDQTPSLRKRDPGGLPEALGLISIPEATWITNTVLYRGQGTLAEWFVKGATKDFGMTFSSTGAGNPTADDLRRARPSAGPLPPLSSDSDFVVSSGTYLRTKWAGNTFSLSKAYRADFQLASGQAKQAEMLTSELAVYDYAKTDWFEAVALPCDSGYLFAVLPALGTSVIDLERELVHSPESLDAALKPQVGRVDLPPFQVRYEAKLRQSLEQMGIRQVFTDLGGMVTIPRSHVTEITQHAAIEVDQSGIRADAETIGGGVYGGILRAQERFRMRLNRPFIFLVRDNATNALLFIGAILDPTQN
jgi:serine protease inhibitor